MDGLVVLKNNNNYRKKFFFVFYGGEAHDIASTPVKNLSSDLNIKINHTKTFHLLTKPFGNPLNIDS